MRHASASETGKVAQVHVSVIKKTRRSDLSSYQIIRSTLSLANNLKISLKNLDTYSYIHHFPREPKQNKMSSFTPDTSLDLLFPPDLISPQVKSQLHPDLHVRKVLPSCPALILTQWPPPRCALSLRPTTTGATSPSSPS
jgi:hypothetical protein